jgi:Asp-tRNA(Asn)/Glu-tRNA(Gln) amidotransferase A subunit family amidase
MPDFGLRVHTSSTLRGLTRNPWHPAHTAGGSSGGEAAAIAAGCSPAGIGSDLGGSIRVPAHFCGVAGLTPTPGRVPAGGHFPPAHGVLGRGMAIGPLARDVADLALLYASLIGFDPADPASIPSARGPGGGKPAGGPPRSRRRPPRVAFYSDDGVAPVTAATREAVEGAARALAERGFEVVAARPPGLERAHDLWRSWLARGSVMPVIALYGGREHLMGPLLRALQAQAQSQPMTLDAFLGAWHERDRLRAGIAVWMRAHPILLAPVASLPAFRHEQRGPFDVEGWTVDYARAFSCAQAFNLLGLPAAAVPWGRSPEGLPIGVQVAGRPFREWQVLETAALLEEAAPGAPVKGAPPPGAPGPRA